MRLVLWGNHREPEQAQVGVREDWLDDPTDSQRRLRPKYLNKNHAAGCGWTYDAS
jgi:hypothetical protein